MNGKLRTGSVTSVVITDANGVSTEVTDQVGIEQACLQENEKRFRQASLTPFMVPPLSTAISHLGIGPAADAILRGTFHIPTGTDPYAAQLISFL